MNNRWAKIRWIISIVILISTMVFVAVNKDLCYNIHKTAKASKKTFTVTSLESNSVCQQKFNGYNGSLKKIGVFLDNQGRENAKGKVVINVIDEDGNIIGTAERKMSAIRTRKYAPFIFKDRPQLEEGKVYTMSIEFKNAVNSQGFGIYTTTQENKWTFDANIDGEEVADGGVFATKFEFYFYDYRAMAVMVVLMILGLLTITIPKEWLEKLIASKTGKEISVDKWISRIIFALAPIIAYMIMESLSDLSLREILLVMFTTEAIMNLILYFILLMILYAITNRTSYSTILLWTITIIFGIVNYFVFKFRGVPVLAADLMSAGTAMNVAAGYEYDYDMCMLWAVSIYGTFTAVMLGMKPYKGFTKFKRAGVVVLAIILGLGANYFFVDSDLVRKFGVEDSQWKPQRTYVDNGSILSFTLTWKYVKTTKPDNYSIESVKKITEGYTSDETSKDSAKSKNMPNVIAIMCESLGDLSVDGNLATSEDYLPFIHSMKENTIKGQLYVSIEGANTANSEFEFLTGNSMAFFPARLVPYNSLVKGVVPSLTRTLSAQGYVGNNAYHPYKRSGWNRENVYNSMGFTEFFSDEYYKNAEFIRNFISDKSDIEQIIADYEAAKNESSDPFYLFNVTVQNHGGYTGNRGMIEAEVKITDKNMQSDDVEQYLTLAKKSDEAFEQLVKYFEQVDEPTVIVMFGDHQPPLESEFYSDLFGKNVDNLSAEQMSKWYSTPYFIWANYDIEEKENFNISNNYLSSYLLKLIGADLTGYNKYLLDLQEKLPVITGLFYAGDDGVFRNIDEESEYSDLINEYAQVQYNGLYEDSKRLKEFFFLEGGDYEVPKSE